MALTCNQDEYRLHHRFCSYAPFVVQITPWLSTCRTFEHNTAHRPNIHGAVPSSLVVTNHLRRHVHGCPSEAVVSPDYARQCRVRFARTLKGPLVLGQDLRRSEVDVLDHTHVVQEYVCSQKLVPVVKESSLKTYCLA